MSSIALVNVLQRVPWVKARRYAINVTLIALEASKIR